MTNIVPAGSVYQETKAKVVDRSIDAYTDNFADTQDSENTVPKEEAVRVRIENAQTMTETFYNLVTDFYEYGYGKSFHFAPLYDAKPFEECIADYEKEAGKMIGATAGMNILVSSKWNIMHIANIQVEASPCMHWGVKDLCAFNWSNLCLEPPADIHSLCRKNENKNNPLNVPYKVCCCCCCCCSCYFWG